MNQNLFDKIIKAFKTIEEFELFARGNAGLIIDIDAALKHNINAKTDERIKMGCTLSYINTFLRKKMSERTYCRKRQEFGLTGKKGK